VVGAVALACQPRFLIADEPTTSLDVTIQMQYLNLLKQIQQEKKLAMLFVTHDLGVVAKMCDRVAVMYAGRIVEIGSVRQIFNDPAHPYTKALMKSVPKVQEKTEQLYTIEGQPPALLDLPPGCSFLPRCQESFGRCQAKEFPPEVSLAGGQCVRCWHYV
jgi:oligopeptide/dipeptide ABC transporter ATP-binding protein